MVNINHVWKRWWWEHVLEFPGIKIHKEKWNKWMIPFKITSSFNFHSIEPFMDWNKWMIPAHFVNVKTIHAMIEILSHKCHLFFLYLSFLQIKSKSHQDCCRGRHLSWKCFIHFTEFWSIAKENLMISFCRKMGYGGTSSHCCWLVKYR